MNWATVIRIALRYGLGALGATALGNQLASDPDVVMTLAGIASILGAVLLEHITSKLPKEATAIWNESKWS